MDSATTQNVTPPPASPVPPASPPPIPTPPIPQPVVLKSGDGGSRPLFTLPNFNLKVLAGVVGVLLLAVGVGVGIYLNNQKTVFKPKANLDPVKPKASLPLDKIQIKDGKLYIHDEWVYLKQAWNIIDFGPKNAYGYSECQMVDSPVELEPGKQIKVYPSDDCMFFGRENPEEYLQYPKILKQRGYNTIKVTVRWDEFDVNGDGVVDADSQALKNLKDFIHEVQREGVFITLLINNYPVGLGGVPDKFFTEYAFNKNIDAQAYGIPSTPDTDGIDLKISPGAGEPILQITPRRWTDCGYKTINPGPNADNTAHPGWPPDDQYNCNNINGDYTNRFVKLPSLTNQLYRDTVKSYIKDLLGKLGDDLASILIYETSVEPMYHIDSYSDFSVSARDAYIAYLQKSNPENCDIQAILNNWPVSNQGTPKQVTFLCKQTDLMRQLTDTNSTWNRFRAFALADYINWEAAAIREGITENLSRNERWRGKAQELASRAIVGADVLDTSSHEDPKHMIRVLGNLDQYVQNLKGINLIQVNWHWRVKALPQVYTTVKKYHPSAAISEQMSYEPSYTDFGGDTSQWANNIFNNSTNFGMEFFHPRPVTNDNMFTKYPSTYSNSWAVYDNNWNPKNAEDDRDKAAGRNLSWRFSLVSQKLLTRGDNGNFPPAFVRDFYPPAIDKQVAPKFKNLALGRNNEGKYYFLAESVDNHLLKKYDLYAIKVDPNDPDYRQNPQNYIVLTGEADTFSANLYYGHEPHYFNKTGINFVSRQPQELDIHTEYEFVINTFDYAGNRCDLVGKNQDDLNARGEEVRDVQDFSKCVLNSSAIVKTKISSLNNRSIRSGGDVQVNMHPKYSANLRQFLTKNPSADRVSVIISAKSDISRELTSLGITIRSTTGNTIRIITADVPVRELGNIANISDLVGIDVPQQLGSTKSGSQSTGIVISQCEKGLKDLYPVDSTCPDNQGKSASYVCSDNQSRLLPAKSSCSWIQQLQEEAIALCSADNKQTIVVYPEDTGCPSNQAKAVSFRCKNGGETQFFQLGDKNNAQASACAWIQQWQEQADVYCKNQVACQTQ